MLGASETSDAHHLSAPHPEGEGALRAMKAALAEAQLAGTQIDYVNLHGTGTPKNDEMEAKAMFNACGSDVLCGSSKGMTGHTLGAAGALEAGICWINAYGNSPAEMPVGGYKQSGIGRENGIETLDHYTQTKSIYVGMADIESPF